MVGIPLTCCGVRIGIRTNNVEALERIYSTLPPNWRPLNSPLVDCLYSLWVGAPPKGRGRNYHLLYRGSERLARTLDLEQLLYDLEGALHLEVAWSARKYLFVHAGVVEWNERAILIPGASMTGKTTLVRALVEAGATYFSDSYAILDSTGNVRPYAKRLSVRGQPGSTELRLSIDDIGGRVGRAPRPVGLVAVVAYKPHARWNPKPISPGQALLALLPNTFAGDLRPKSTLATLQRAVSSASAVKGDRGEYREMVGRLMDMAQHG